MKFIVPLLIVLLTVTACRTSQNKHERLVQKLMHQHEFQEIDFEIEFKKLGKEAIPYLIEAINHKKMGFVGFGDPMSSKIQSFHYNYVGIRAAYMIEYILSGAKEPRLYHYAVIVKSSDPEFRMETLNEADLEKVKAIYEQWWALNRDKTLNELIVGWKANSRPLINQDYKWV